MGTGAKILSFKCAPQNQEAPFGVSLEATIVISSKAIAATCPRNQPMIGFENSGAKLFIGDGMSEFVPDMLLPGTDTALRGRDEVLYIWMGSGNDREGREFALVLEQVEKILESRVYHRISIAQSCNRASHTDIGIPAEKLAYYFKSAPITIVTII